MSSQDIHTKEKRVKILAKYSYDIKEVEGPTLLSEKSFSSCLTRKRKGPKGLFRAKFSATGIIRVSSITGCAAPSIVFVSPNCMNFLVSYML